MLELPGVRVVPNGVDLQRFQPEPETPGRRLLFVGSFRHFPNIDAYRFFTERVWPTLRARYPDITLTVVAGPDPMLHWSSYTGTLAPPSDDRIRVLGFVSDVRPLYIETNLVIVPTTVSAGTNLKVLEAMAMERAVVSTTSGCAGLGLEHFTSVWRADGVEAFAAGISTLLENQELRQNIASEARRLAMETFDWSRLGDVQAALWRELLDE
jgi:glycosyltransferase involved in cell wall biosynthesis